MKLIFILTLVLPIFAHASRLNVDYFKKYYVSEKGFRVEIADTNWLKSTFEKNDNLEMVFQTKQKSSGTLSVRIDEETIATNLAGYVKDWIPKFSQFGLDVQNHQYFKVTPDLQAFIVDLINSTSGKYVRQVIFHKNKKAVIFTCMDNGKTFRTTVHNCNELIKSFAWVSI